MSFKKKYIPEISDLRKRYEDSKSDIDFIKEVVGNADVIMGSEESCTFINSIQEKIKAKTT